MGVVLFLVLLYLLGWMLYKIAVKIYRDLTGKANEATARAAAARDNRRTQAERRRMTLQEKQVRQWADHYVSILHGAGVGEQIDLRHYDGPWWNCDLCWTQWNRMFEDAQVIPTSTPFKEPVFGKPKRKRNLSSR